MMVAGSVKLAPSWLRLAGSSPRSKRVPNMVASIALQFSALAAFNTATSCAANSGTATVWNKPPLNQGRSSTPNRPPSRMV